MSKTERRVLVDFNKYKDIKDINRSIITDLEDEQIFFNFSGDITHKTPIESFCSLNDLIMAIENGTINMENFIPITSEAQAQEVINKLKNEFNFTFEANSVKSEAKEIEESLSKIDDSTDKMKSNINSFEDIANTVTIERVDRYLNDVPNEYLDDYIKRKGRIYVMYHDTDSLVPYFTSEETIGTLIGYTDTSLKIKLDNGEKARFDEKYDDIEYDLIMGLLDRKRIPINLERIYMIIEN